MGRGTEEEVDGAAWGGARIGSACVKQLREEGAVEAALTNYFDFVSESVLVKIKEKGTKDQG
jgi:hypothetical protein